MDIRHLNLSDWDTFFPLHSSYKEAIGETVPTADEQNRLKHAIEAKQILFFGCFDDGKPVGCCSVSLIFSTFCYGSCGIFEDFYIKPEYRHKGIARALVQFAYETSGVSSMTVGCADCDRKMYESLGFSVPIGNLLAFRI